MTTDRTARWPRPDGLSSPEPKRRPASGLALGPVLAFVALWLGGSGMVIGAWLAPVLPGGWLPIVVALASAAVPVRTLVRGYQRRSYPGKASRLRILRPFWYAMMTLPMLAAATVLGAALGLAWGQAGPGGRWGLAIASVAIGLAIAVGYVGSRSLVVRRLDVRLPRLPAAFDGLRVVQLSDLHVGPHTSQRFLVRIAQAVREADPDLIVYTGDQVDDFARDVGHVVRAFGDLEAPMGSFVVAGNHDVYAGWDGVAHGLEAAGFTVLVNRSVALERGGSRLWIAGTGDPAARAWPGGARSAAPDIGRTLAEVRSGDAVLALAHNPALWPALAARGVDLTLSGHTHYGQLAIPRLGWSMASPFLKLAMGAHRQGSSLLYINPGTNHWGLPLRIGTPPEVTVLTLRRAEEGRADLQAAGPAEPA